MDLTERGLNMAQMIDRHASHYMTLAAAQPQLTLEEELALARAYRDRGDADAAKRIITANLRHVIPVALRYRRYGVPMSELIAEGNLALMRSLDKFDPERGLRFVTYAKFWVRAEILAFVLRQKSMVGGGRGALQPKFFFRLRREHARLHTLLGDDREVVRLLADKFHKRPEEIEMVLERLRGGDASLDAAATADGQPWVQSIPGDLDQEKAVAKVQMRAQLAVAVRDAIDAFDDRERFIIEHRLMAHDDDEKTLVEIGDALGISRERARQIEARVKDKLRRRLLAFAPVDAAA